MLRCRAEAGVKCAALNLLAAVVGSMEPHDMDVAVVQLDALKHAAACAKDRYSEAPVKCEPGSVLPAIEHLLKSSHEHSLLLCQPLWQRPA